MNDPYVYPGTAVLKNIPGIRVQKELARYERLITGKRMSQPLHGLSLTVKSYRSLHRHIFQDVYEWAGEFRTVDVAKGNAYFGRAAYVAAEVEKRFALIRAEAGLDDRGRFVVRSAEHVAEINAIHPFREGNGRTLRLFLKEWAHRLGFELSLRRIEPDAWMKASIDGFQKQDYRAMEQVIERSITGPARS